MVAPISAGDSTVSKGAFRGFVNWLQINYNRGVVEAGFSASGFDFTLSGPVKPKVFLGLDR